MASSVDNLFLGKGVLYFDRLTAGGASTGLRDLGECKDFSITMAVEKKEHRTARTGLGERDLEVIVGSTATCSFVMEEFVIENWLLAVMGDEVADNQTSGAVEAGAPETITAKKGRWIPLAHRQVSTVVVKNSGLSTTYTAGADEDYVVNAELGWIYIVEDGDIAADASLKVTYAYATDTRNAVAGMTNAEAEGKLVFVPADDQYGPRNMAEVWKVRLAPNGPIGFISEEFASMTVEGSIIKDTTYSDYPYFKISPITET